jgi:hypothetical protein
METFMPCFIVVFLLKTFTPCLQTVKKWFKKRHSDVYRIETTIKHDINVSITPPPLFHKGSSLTGAFAGAIWPTLVSVLSSGL